MISKIRANFFTGIVIIVPLVITFAFFYFILDRLNLLLLDPAVSFLDKWFPAENIKFLIKISVLLLLLCSLTAIGLAARILVVRNIFGFGEKILYKVPMISTIYKATKEISFSFFAQKDTIFKDVVLVEYPRKGVYQIGFIIARVKGEIEAKTKKPLVNIFIPTTPNPTSGMLVLVPKEDLIVLDMRVADAMKMVISGGAVAPGIYYGNSENRSGAFEKEGFKGN
jgi:uncharacterized membrane protein